MWFYICVNKMGVLLCSKCKKYKKNIKIYFIYNSNNDRRFKISN